MKYLFLDVDGVLNSARFFATQKLARDLRPRDFDPYKVLLVHRICEATGARVVVSSSWRLGAESLERVKEVVGDLYLDKTPRHANYDDRHAEIREWLESHPEYCTSNPSSCPPFRAACLGMHHRYAILDDDLVASHGHGVSFFKTEWYGDGLTDEIADAVIAHLNR